MKKTVLLVILALTTMLAFSQDDGNQLYDNSVVHELEIISNYPGNLIDSLDSRHQNEFSEQIDWSYMQVNAYFDGNYIDSIGIRIKGGDVSYSTVKPSLKLDLNEFVSDRRYDGLKKINIDNCFHDPSLMREKLYYDLASELGLKSSRTSFVKVIIDGVSFGNYVYIEQVNKQFLKANFGNKNGNLFKVRGGGGLSFYGNNTQNDYPWQYDLKTNETADDWSDLLLLIDKANNTSSANFMDTISRYLNVDAVLNYMALGTYTVYSDNVFSGGNNGYWYHNTETDKFELIPWDIDLSFKNSSLQGYQYTASNTELMNPIVDHGVFGKLLDVPEFKTSYLEKCCFIHHHLGHQDALIDKINEYKSILQAGDITPDVNCDYTSFLDPNDIFIAGYTFLGLKDFAEIRHQKMISELAASNFNCTNTTEASDLGMEKFAFTLYPNPASDYIMINFENNNLNIINASIINSMGQVVKTHQGTSPKIDVGKLSPGLYFILIQRETEQLMGTFIKK